MDIEKDASINKFFMDAAHRVDGKAMYLVLIVFVLGSLWLAAVNALNGDYSFLSWKIIIGSVCMLPITIIVYVGLASYSQLGDVSGRWVNAIIILFIPVYFYFKLN